MNNMAEYFPILKYKDGELTRVNGSKLLIGGEYALLPLFSVNQECFCDVFLGASIKINNNQYQIRPAKVHINVGTDLPDPCFLVAVRHGYPYTPEEVESLNKTWDKLMSELKNEG